MQLSCWIALGLVAYVYVGYPVLLWIAARAVGRLPEARTDYVPSVSFVIPAHNEAGVISAKLANTLALDYPVDRVEILVGADGCTDGTVEAVRAVDDPRIRLVDFPQRQGKLRMLNRLVPLARHEVTVFSDASSMLGRDALRYLVAPLADARVGAVCGLYRLGAPAASARDIGEGWYWRYETAMKQLESRLSSILGTHGALYAIRTALFSPVDPSLINDDFLIPMQLVVAGHRAVYAPAARAVEAAATSERGEFRRRMRITAGNYQQMRLLPQLLRARRGCIVWQFVSHKVLRTLSPLLLLWVLVASAVIATPVFRALWWAQVVFYASGLAAPLVAPYAWGRPLAVPYYFLSANAAALLGLGQWLLGRHSAAWTRHEA